MPGQPWSHTATVFTVRGVEFRAVPNFAGGVTLQRWVPRLRSWRRLGVFATRAEARGYARRFMLSPPDDRD